VSFFFGIVDSCENVQICAGSREKVGKEEQNKTAFQSSAKRANYVDRAKNSDIPKGYR